jgi:hypothetical protein
VWAGLRRHNSKAFPACIRAAPDLLKLGECAGQQFILRPEQKLDLPQPLYHVRQYVFHLQSGKKISDSMSS